MDGGLSTSGIGAPCWLPDALAAALLPRGRLVQVRPGQVIIAEGTSSTDVYFIVSGRLQVSVVSPGGRETMFRTLGANELFGEMAAIDAVERSATVVAIDAGTVCLLTADQFLRYMAQVPDAGLWMMRQLTGRLRDLSNRVFELANLTVSGRVAAELLRLAPEGRPDADGAAIATMPTHADLAALIGTNRETVTRELGSLAEQGLIHQAGRRLTIMSRARLRQIVERQQR